MKGLALFALTLLVAGFQSGFAQRIRSFKPTHPVICYQSFQNRPDHVGVSERFNQLRQKGAGRVKTATFEVQFINFPSDNAAKTAFQFAVDIWESELISPVPVKIVAQWKELDAGVLGEALWGRAYANFGGEQHINTFYPVALAEKMAGRELNDASEADIVASFNSKASWYFGTDGNTPTGKMDMVTIVLHEIAHGLGFTDTYDVEGTEGSVGLETGGSSVPFIFDLFIENDANDNLLHDFQSPSTGLRDALQSTNLFFDSPLSAAALGGVKPELFAPATFDGGSSISHLDETTFSGSGDANRLMTPQIAFAESIHAPGNVLLGMLADMGWVNTSIVHQALKDTELKNGQPYKVTVDIRSDNGYDPSAVKLHYTNDGINYTIVPMTLTGVADQYEASLPGTTVNLAYAYFISVVDGQSRTFTNPGKVQEPGAQPVQGTHFFNVGPDLTAPEIVHEPIVFIFEEDSNLSLRAEVTDNLGVKEVVVEYSLNGGTVQTEVMEHVPDTDTYTATISPPALTVGDEMQYRIAARDLAAVENVSFHPSAGHHVVAVNGIQAARDSYSNNFDEASSDFFGNSFSIATPQGFENGAIHCDHPYNNGTGLNEESNYVYQLQIPIRIASTNALIQFDEIVLVEPGEDGAAFGDPGFFDYVVVEGSDDGGASWVPFAPGYDSRAASVWLNRYNQEIVDDNSQSAGDPTLYLKRSIDMLESGDFVPGDEVLVRFRLFADALAHGWGWAIDNLSIQGPVTGIEENASPTFKVYPVPVTHDLLVEFRHPEVDNVSLEISDLQGRTVFSEAFDSAPGVIRRTVNVQFLMDGFYVLKARAGDRIFVRKFLKVAR